MKTAALLLFAVCAWGQIKSLPVAGQNPKRGNVLPASCRAGDLFMNLAASPGQQLYTCSSNNVWVAISGGGGGSSSGSVLTTVTFSATPTYTVSTSSVQVFKITLTGNISSATLDTSLATAGQVIAWDICQDGSGAHTVAWPTNVLNYGSVDTTASACSKQSFLWDGTNAVAAGPMVSDVATPAIVTSAGSLSLPTAPDTLVGRASTDTLTNKTLDTASNTVKLAGTTITGKAGNTGVVQTAGTMSGSAGAAVCTDGSGNTTTSGCTAGAPTAGTSVSVSGTAVSYNPFDTSQLIISDESFCNAGNVNGGTAQPVGTYGWFYALTSAGTQITPSASSATDANHPCGIHIAAPASINNGEYIAQKMFSSLVIPSAILGGANFRPWEIQFQAKLSATANIRVSFGISPTTLTMPTTSSTGCGFRYDTTVPDSNWIGWCSDSTALQTVVVTGTVDTNIHRFRIWATASGTINFSVDGGTTAQITTHTPVSGSSVVLMANVINDGTSTTSALDIFRIVARVTGLVVN